MLYKSLHNVTENSYPELIPAQREIVYYKSVLLIYFLKQESNHYFKTYFVWLILGITSFFKDQMITARGTMLLPR